MISVAHFTTEDPAFPERARVALEVLAARPGYLRGSMARSSDEPTRWVLVCEWADVGSYRRGLGAYEVKLKVWPLLYGAAPDLPTSFEPLITAAPGQSAVVRVSDVS